METNNNTDSLRCPDCGIWRKGWFYHNYEQAICQYNGDDEIPNPTVGDHNLFNLFYFCEVDNVWKLDDYSQNNVECENCRDHIDDLYYDAIGSCEECDNITRWFFDEQQNLIGYYTEDGPNLAYLYDINNGFDDIECDNCKTEAAKLIPESLARGRFGRGSIL
jgi:hypothetical protein